MRKEQNTESSNWQTRGNPKKVLLSVVGACLSVTLLSSSVLAEGCVSSPSCTAMGYTESSCSDGGVKCPWGNYWFCGAKKDVCQSCYVGWILNSDMTCSVEKASGKTPIGVVSQQTMTTVGAAIKCQGVAVTLSDLSGTMTWSNAKSACSSYSVGGVSGWRLPAKDELIAVYGNKSAVSSGLTAAGGTQFTSAYYWSSSVHPGNASSYGVVNPVGGGTSYNTTSNSNYVRPVLAFAFES